MLIDCTQLRDVIIVPTISALGLDSPSAVNLLLGTCAQESHLGKYLIQMKIGAKGAVGIYQCEDRTYHHVWTNVINKSISMKARFRLMLGYDGKPDFIRMASDFMLATAIARLYYSTFPEPLPAADDLPGLAAYWKKYWNTTAGKGTVEQFSENYRRYVKAD